MQGRLRRYVKVVFVWFRGYYFGEEVEEFLETDFQKKELELLNGKVQIEFNLRKNF